MANIKKITHLWNTTGLTLYCIIRRDADGYLLNDADGAFANAPADPYISLAEDATIKGMYELSEARAAWNDGKYSIVVYRQTGTSPAPASDIVIGGGVMEIRSDLEVVNVELTSTQVTALVAAIEAEIADDATGAAVKQAIIDKLIENLPDIDELTLSAIAQSVWEYTTRALTDKVNFALTTDYPKLTDLETKEDIQDGLATGADVTAAQAAIIEAVNDATPDIDFPTAEENAGAVWDYGSRTLTGVTGTISWPVVSSSVKQDYIDALTSLVPGDLPLSEPDKIFAINQALKSYSVLRPRFISEDEDGAAVADYNLTLLADWIDGFSVIKTVEYPVDDDDEEGTNILQDDSWKIYQKPTGKFLRFLEDKPSVSEDFRVIYTGVHLCTDEACTVPYIDEGAVQLLAAANFCNMLATYYAQTSDSTIMADSVDHKSKASEYAARARAYRQEYQNHMGVKDGNNVGAASVTKDQDATPSWRRDNLTHPRKFR